MPEPVTSSANGSVYDRTQLMSDASCDPSMMTCAPTSGAKVLTLEPVMIEGEASRKELVAGYDKTNRSAPDCRNEAVAAVAGCAALAASVVGTLASSPTGLGLVAGSLATAFNAANCVRLIDDYADCKDLGAARAAAADRCEERGGMPLSGGAENEIICLVSEQ